MSCLCTKYRKPSKNTLENTTIPTANVGEFFLDKHIYVDSFLHGHIKIVGHLKVTLKIAITDENILFFLKSLCILSEEASRKGFFICLLAFVLREVLAYLCNPGRPSTHSNPPSTEITACLTTLASYCSLRPSPTNLDSHHGLLKWLSLPPQLHLMCPKQSQSVLLFGFSNVPHSPPLALGSADHVLSLPPQMLLLLII